MNLHTYFALALTVANTATAIGVQIPPHMPASDSSPMLPLSQAYQVVLSPTLTASEVKDVRQALTSWTITTPVVFTLQTRACYPGAICLPSSIKTPHLLAPLTPSQVIGFQVGVNMGVSPNVPSEVIRTASDLEQWQVSQWHSLRSSRVIN